MNQEPPTQSQMDEAKERAKQSQSLVPTVMGGTSGEIAPTAGAAQVQAMVQARFVMAIKQPRNMDVVRQELIKECSRPNFALEEREGEGNSALYRRPVGGGKFAEGLGIRFAEVAERCMGNLMSGALTIAEDEKKKTKYCFVLDLQTNNSWEDTIDISKTVERRQTKQGDEVLGSRTNSTGQQVFTIAASEDALATKEAALISKKLRTLILRLIPGDLQDECIKTIRDIRTRRVTDDPEGAKKRVIDGMMVQNVSVTMLEEYLGHPVGQSTPAEIVNLQGIYGALRDGITTWKDIMDDVERARQIKPEAKPGAATDAPDKGMEGAKAAAAAESTPVTPTPAVTPSAPAPPPVTTPVAPVAPQAAAPPPPVVTEPIATPAPAAPPPVPAPPVAPAAPVTGGPPSWAAQPPAAPPVVAAPVVETPAPQPAQPAPPPAAPVQPQTAVSTLPGGPGKIIKDVQFPARMTRENEQEAWTQEQFIRATAELANLNTRLGKSFKLESTVKNWFSVSLDEINSATMECIIAVIVNWK